ncbi:hypothetical protein B296_00034955 [Ensete ventricosum]|uniref:BTB domain-containing protein n=1 Tax=Ensete ventricosum TaxID=4639 RepID=A0A427A704_ENSVE|nr:hypothetical protein B296_00034955 [Ensete ventricosum]
MMKELDHAIGEDGRPGGSIREMGNSRTDPSGGDDADVQILTTRKRRIPAHSKVLAAASPVLESMLDRPQKRGGEGRVIPILGVPHDAVCAFVRLLYSVRTPQFNLCRCWICRDKIHHYRMCVTTAVEGEEAPEVGEHGVHLLVLSHVYQVGWLKRACERALASRLTAEGVVDVLVLARRCDAPWLHLRCMRFIARDYAAVERTEAWRFLQDNDPWLELDILQSLQDAHLKRRRRKREVEKVYTELSEAMECLQHICAEGCTEIGPSGRGPPPRDPTHCPNPATCRGLQQLIHHFAACDRKKKPPPQKQQQQQQGCPRCKRLWQLLRLHSAICVHPDPCKVPLCSQFKQKMEQTKRKEEEEEAEKWKLLVKKVASARVVSYLVKRKRQEGIQSQEAWLQQKLID